jgi:hypothetical protein
MKIMQFQIYKNELFIKIGDILRMSNIRDKFGPDLLAQQFVPFPLNMLRKY